VSKDIAPEYIVRNGFVFDFDYFIIDGKQIDGDTFRSALLNMIDWFKKRDNEMIALRKYHDRVTLSSIFQIGNSLVIKTDKGLIEFEFINGEYQIITDTIKG